LLSPAQNAVVAALFTFVHMHPGAAQVRVGKITEFAKESLKTSGEGFRLTPRKLTGILASFGFGEIHRSSPGSQRAIDQEAVQKIHRLALQHNVMLVDKEGLG
jgi:hypothetical protein